MRIALFCESRQDGGGGLYQSLSTIEELTGYSQTDHQFLVFTPWESTRVALAERGINAIRFRRGIFSLLDLFSATLAGGAFLRRLRRLGPSRLGRHLDALLDDHRVDLAFFTAYGEAPQRIGDHAFVVTLWDLDHRDHPEFPESFRNRAFERRERSLGTTLIRATAIVVSSAYHAQRVALLYRVDPTRIVTLPFLPHRAMRAGTAGLSKLADVRARYGIPEEYVFYPAFFSFHKNHLYLLEALADLSERKGIALHAVFCGGGDPGDQEAVERQVEPLGLRGRIHFPGLVSEADLRGLYDGAIATVMPSYFGPTNLPPVEALFRGCPVICSDFPGTRDQMGQAALYCDLDDPRSLSDHISGLLTDPQLREKMLAEASQKARELEAVSYYEILKPILREFDYRKRRWDWPRRDRATPLRTGNQ